MTIEEAVKIISTAIPVLLDKRISDGTRRMVNDAAETIWEYFAKDNNVPCKSDVTTHCIPLENREDILQELVWYREGTIHTMQPEYVDALIEALKSDAT